MFQVCWKKAICTIIPTLEDALKVQINFSKITF